MQAIQTRGRADAGAAAGFSFYFAQPSHLSFGKPAFVRYGLGSSLVTSHFARRIPGETP